MCKTASSKPDQEWIVQFPQILGMRKHKEREVDLPTRLLYGMMWFVPIFILSNLFVTWIGASIMVVFVAILQNALFVLLIYAPMLLWGIKSECQKNSSWIQTLLG
ncbi:unnamed protein product [Acanthoscelides obtectus]|uniref:Uncharacterized protein n=1 Tax=Acanthoscelides obtectus TaxID=200917 RepID=A0A9P0KF09_ACAOB|nr:unnamed protein product [Acanthoscelides obtectus]CAK1648194.1 hypothetical protein AOBTE_LOCUS15595 [Acanthoscelides obtectus]